MLNKTLANKLVKTAAEQLKQGLDAKAKRMKNLVEISDLYNNKTMEADDEMMNIPFPFLAGYIDQIYSKIDNPPTLTFKLPNKKALSDKIKSAWMQDMNSVRSGWNRKDRAEKKLALLTGRGVAKVYASSVNNEYRSQYDVVDIYSFVADPTRGFLEDGNYHGETDIFKTKADLKRMAEAGFYDKGQVQQLINRKDTPKDGDRDVTKLKFDRLKALGVDVESTSFAGQEGVNMTEWIMQSDGEWYYLLFDPKSNIWVRAELLKDVFENGKTPYVSWATHYDEYSFWSKGVGDDVYPIAEAIRFLLNHALENEKRRTRPMKIVESGALIDLNELQDYVPDNVILSNQGRDANVITVETPEASTTINVVQYLDSVIQAKGGVTDPSIEETDAKVGVFYGRLQQEADRIGAINKEYSESYAHKGYRYFWGLKQHLTEKKMVEMLGGKGLKLQALEGTDFKDVDDVDDILVSGGSQEEQLNAIEAERQRAAIAELTGAYPDRLNPEMVIRETLTKSGYDEEKVERFLDVDQALDPELMDEADEAINEVLQGRTPRLNMSATPAFVQRILDFVRDELNYVILDDDGNQTGIDEKMKEHSDKLLAFIKAHEKVMVENMTRKRMKDQLAAGIGLEGQPAEAGVDVPGPSQTQQRAAVARPFESPAGTPESTQEVSAVVSQGLR